MGIETIALAAVTGSSVMNAAGAYQQGQAASKNAAYQAQIAAMNSRIAQQNAGYEIAKGEQQETQQQLKTRAVVGSMEAAQGANGLDVNSGSNLRVRESAEQLGAQDAQTIQTNATRSAWNYEAQAAGLTAQSTLDRQESKQENVASYFAAGSSLLSGASKFAGTQYEFED